MARSGTRTVEVYSEFLKRWRNVSEHGWIGEFEGEPSLGACTPIHGAENLTPRTHYARPIRGRITLRQANVAAAPSRSSTIPLRIISRIGTSPEL